MTDITFPLLYHEAVPVVADQNGRLKHENWDEISWEDVFGVFYDGLIEDAHLMRTYYNNGVLMEHESDMVIDLTRVVRVLL
jgi:hypothetical protein